MRNDKEKYIATLLVVIYTSSWFLLRPLGPAPLLLLLASIIYLIGVVELQSSARMILLPIAIFVLGGFFVAGLSLARIYEPANKYYFSTAAVLQQSLYLITLPLAIAFWASFFQTSRFHFSARTWWVAILLTWLWASTLQAIFGGLDEDAADAFAIGTLHSSEMVLLFCLIYFTFVKSGRGWGFMACIIILVAVAGSAQSLLSVLAIPIIRILGKRSASLALIVCTPILVAVAIPNAEKLYDLDPNTGVRAMFWRDVARDLSDSKGIGIGFGNEAIAPQYYSYEHEITIVNPEYEQERFLVTGTHNSFMDVAQRLGIAGLSVFIFMLGYPILMLIRAPDMQEFDAWVICTLLITLTVNVALSVAFVFGTGMLWGWIVARAQVLGGRRAV